MIYHEGEHYPYPDYWGLIDLGGKSKCLGGFGFRERFFGGVGDYGLAMSSARVIT